jgi:D-alanyl-D-alanine carboxypeptidase/D-alanyl-D-alanine-endopeptidase (penicillin-binding protein 4)
VVEGDASHAGPASEPAVTPSRRDGRLLRRTTGGLVVVVLAAAVASYQFDLGDRLGLALPDPSLEPAAVAPPFELPAAVPAAAVAGASTLVAANPAAVSRAIRRLATAPKLGPSVAVAVAEVSTGDTVFTSGTPVVTPASTMKLLTTMAALDAMGPDHRFETTVVRTGRRLVLVGGGDPLLTRVPPGGDAYPRRADLTTLAAQTAKALATAGFARVRLGYDTSLFTGTGSAPTWPPDYVGGNVVSPITSLWVDEGREHAGNAKRSPDPALAAAQFFATALAKQGVRVAGIPTSVVAPAAAKQVAAVSSPPLAQIVQRTLELSDNEAAEVLAHQVAVAEGDEASFDGAAASVEKVLRTLGVRLRGASIHDGSGLSRADRLHHNTLLDVLQVAAAEPRLRTVVTGLPVAGYTGSLSYRFETASPDALGEVRAKTGTLTGVSGLAGTVMTRDGVLLTFVAIADKVKPQNTLDARAKLDELAGALAECVCG